MLKMLGLLSAEATFSSRRPSQQLRCDKQKDEKGRILSILENQQVRDRVGNKSCLAWFVFTEESADFLERG